MKKQKVRWQSKIKTQYLMLSPLIPPALGATRRGGWRLGQAELVAAPVLLRGPPVPMRTGAQAALLLLLLASVTFPAFNALGITAAMGLLVALGVEAVA